MYTLFFSFRIFYKLCIILIKILRYSENLKGRIRFKIVSKIKKYMYIAMGLNYISQMKLHVFSLEEKLIFL